jgi:uncharacterized protein YrzB (UPF0473 family)
MNFKIYEDGKEITCEIVLTFRDENNDINYIVYTDGTKDDEDDLEVYASRYVIKDNNFYLEAIENESEWNLIDNMLEAKYKGID